MEYKWLYKSKYSTPPTLDEEYQKRINSLSTYKYDFSIGQYPVFVVTTSEILQAITEIQRLDKELLKKISKDIPKIAYQQFVQKCLIDEVLQTVEMEGVVSSRQEIKSVLDNKTPKNRGIIGITKKYERLMKQNNVPLANCRDIRKLYDEILLEEVSLNDIKNIPDGEIFRKNEVYIKDERREIIHTGIFPESEIIQEMTSLLKILENPTYNPLINIAVMHYMIGYIHPFYDGNGRISRFISSYLLSEQLEKIVGYRLAYTIKKDISKYYKMFKLTNDKDNRGDLTPFTTYFLELIVTSLKELLNYFNEQNDKLNYYKKCIGCLDLCEDDEKLMFVLVQNALFAYEGLTSEQLCGISKKSISKIRSELKTLNDFELLKITKKRPYLYSANIEKLNSL